jgi:ribosomal protein L7Ae-like RNA K-turn-binding protein
MPSPQSQRSNAVNRRKAEASTLLHWVRSEDGTPWPDWSGRLSSMGVKGVWTDYGVVSLREAVKRQVFVRAWGAGAGVEPSLLEDRYQQSGEAYFLQRLGLCLRSGAMAVGHEAVRERMTGAKSGLLLLSVDAGESSRTRYTRNVERKQGTVVEMASGERLGRALGREFVSCVWVDTPPWVDDLSRLASALNGLPAGTIVSYDDAAARVGRAAGSQDSAVPGEGVTSGPGHDVPPRR